MSTYGILIRGNAEKKIQRVPPQHFTLIEQHIDVLADNPRPPDAKKLRGAVGYSLRVGVYRILYEVDDQRHEVTIYRAKHRRDVYR